DRDRHPLGLLVVGREMLDRRPHAPRLQPLDEGRRQLAREQRVLRVVLEVASAQWGALEIDPGSEQNIYARGARLVAERRADASGELLVPARGDRDRRGKAGRGIGPLDAQMVAFFELHPQTVR